MFSIYFLFSRASLNTLNDIFYIKPFNTQIVHVNCLHRHQVSFYHTQLAAHAKTYNGTCFWWGNDNSCCASLFPLSTQIHWKCTWYLLYSFLFIKYHIRQSISQLFNYLAGSFVRNYSLPHIVYFESKLGKISELI